MLYRPHFCCHCGEKITRAKWTPLTSRRFCDFCAVEQKQHDLLPRAAAVLMLIFGAAGITSYLGSGKSIERSANLTTAEPRSVSSKATSVSVTTNQNTSSPPPIAPAANAGNSAVNTLQREVKRNSSTEPVYYCGALTKKGTPCTRRVKTPGRCWQHLGQPSAIDGRK
jgi:hypothetical protein